MGWFSFPQIKNHGVFALLGYLYEMKGEEKSNGAQVTVQTYSKDRECGDLQGIPREVPGTQTNTLVTNLWTQMMLPVSLTLATLV